MLPLLAKDATETVYTIYCTIFILIGDDTDLLIP